MKHGAITLSYGWEFNEDESEAWFIGGEDCGLYHVDMDREFIKCESELPIMNSEHFGRYSVCSLHDSKLICFPKYSAEGVLVYDTIERQWTKVEHMQSEREYNIDAFSVIGNEIWAFSRGLSLLFSINLKKREISYEHYFDVSDYNTLLCSFHENKAYLVDSVSGELHIYDMHENTEQCLDLDRTEVKRISGLCFDGRAVWFTGYSREIISYDIEKNRYDHFQIPEDVKIYEYDGKSHLELRWRDSETLMPYFESILLLNGCIWLIPFYADRIVYVDINYESTNKKKINELIICGEERTKDDFKNHALSKIFVLCYIRCKRFIGLYSTKNDWIVEVDTISKEYSIRGFHSDISVYRYLSKKVLREEKRVEREAFWGCIGITR